MMVRTVLDSRLQFLYDCTAFDGKWHLHVFVLYITYRTATVHTGQAQCPALHM
jgi:hypothetical protein